MRSRGNRSKTEKRLRGEKTDAHGEALTSRKGKTDYGGQKKRDTQPGHGNRKTNLTMTTKRGSLTDNVKVLLISLDRHLSQTTWGADRTTLLHFYLVLVHSKLDYSAHVYCTASPRALRILDPVQNEGLRLATVAFRSSPIPSLHVESNVLPLDLHSESLVVKTLLRPYFLSFAVLAGI